MKCFLTLCFLCVAATVSAQPRPGAFTTVTATDTSVASVCVGCPVGTTTPAANSGLTAATVILANGAPSNTSFKLYQVAGTLFFNGAVLATGSSVSGTTGNLSKFTSSSSLGNSIITESGSTITVPGTVSATLFSGSGTSLTGVGLLASANAWTNTQTFTPAANTLPMTIVGSDSATTGIVLSLKSNSSGRASGIHFTDNVTYNAAIGADGSGNFVYWANRFPGGSGVGVFSVTTSGNGSFAGALAVTGASTLIGTVSANTINAGAMTATTLGTSGLATLASLSVSGASTLTGTVSAGNLNASGTITAAALGVTGTSSLTILGVSGTSNFSGLVTTNALNANGLVQAPSLNVTGATTIGSTLLVGTSVTMSGANAQMTSAGYAMTTWNTTAAAANAQVANGDVVRLSTSLRANKHDIASIPLAEARTTVMGLRAVLYRSRIDEDQRQWAGFIAEEVQDVNPVLAVYRPDGPLQSVSYDRVPAFLVPVVQDQERRIEALERALALAQSHSDH